ncbi:hypothetical protein CRG98_001074 [Punica granatum]|uniref:CCHC-type domain-containing protein n=1 Tax=Punica granatum TaxID=22663 RepID=A0A2I0LE72_PUNGR|nr:hypothetical protein CRG98_001074 [Punica granatum]
MNKPPSSTPARIFYFGLKSDANPSSAAWEQTAEEKDLLNRSIKRAKKVEAQGAARSSPNQVVSGLGGSQRAEGDQWAVRYSEVLKGSPAVVERTVVWVRIPSRLVQLHCGIMLRRIGAALGLPIRIDKNTQTVSQGIFAGLCIEVDLTKSLRPEIEFDGKLYQVEFEGLHLICVGCGRYGHRKEGCVTVTQHKAVAGDLGANGPAGGAQALSRTEVGESSRSRLTASYKAQTAGNKVHINVSGQAYVKPGPAQPVSSGCSESTKEDITSLTVEMSVTQDSHGSQDIAVIVEPRISGNRADVVCRKLRDFDVVHVEARGFSGAYGSCGVLTGSGLRGREIRWGLYSIQMMLPASVRLSIDVVCWIWEVQAPIHLARAYLSRAGASFIGRIEPRVMENGESYSQKLQSEFCPMSSLTTILFL